MFSLAPKSAHPRDPPLSLPRCLPELLLLPAGTGASGVSRDPGCLSLPVSCPSCCTPGSYRRASSCECLSWAAKLQIFLVALCSGFFWRPSPPLNNLTLPPPSPDRHLAFASYKEQSGSNLPDELPSAALSVAPLPHSLTFSEGEQAAPSKSLQKQCVVTP